MKKILIYCFLLIFFLACDGENNKKLKSYEAALNNFINKIDSSKNKTQAKCKIIKDFIECKKDTINIANEQNEYLKINNLLSKTNAYYNGKNSDFISINEYLESIKSNVLFQEIDFDFFISDYVVSNFAIFAMLFKNMEIINLLKDNFNVNLKIIYTKKINDLNIFLSTSAKKSKINITINSSLNLDKKMLETLNSKGFGYINNEKKSLFLINKNMDFNELKKYLLLKNIEINLDANDASKIKNTIIDFCKILNASNDFLEKIDKIFNNKGLKIKIIIKANDGIKLNEKTDFLKHLTIFLNDEKIEINR